MKPVKAAKFTRTAFFSINLFAKFTFGSHDFHSESKVLIQFD